MTAAELIEHLKTVEPDAVIIAGDLGEGIAKAVTWEGAGPRDWGSIELGPMPAGFEP